MADVFDEKVQTLIVAALKQHLDPYWTDDSVVDDIAKIVLDYGEVCKMKGKLEALLELYLIEGVEVRK